jgi:hypothetical protein
VRNIYVVILPEEIAWARHVATQRDAINKRMGVIDRLVDQRDPLKGATLAICAEIAVARLFNVLPDFNTDPRKLRPFDLCWGEERIDVKRANTSHMNIPVRRKPPNGLPEATAYVSVSGIEPRFCVEGWIDAVDAHSDEFWRPDAQLPCWAIPKARLVDLSGLWDRVQMQLLRPCWAEGN